MSIRISTVAADDPNAISSTVATMRRADVFSNNVVLGTSGTLRLTYFTPAKPLAATQVRVATGGTAAAATPTLCRIGLYSVAANGDLTLVGSTANDTTLFAATTTAYTRSLTATANLAAGTRYAMGIVVVSGVTLPSFAGQIPSLPNTETALAPALSASVTGQPDLPSSLAVASIQFNTAQRFYGVFL
jgi:hypothetical protein